MWTKGHCKKYPQVLIFLHKEKYISQPPLGSLYSRGWLIQGPTTGQCAENKERQNTLIKKETTVHCLLRSSTPPFRHLYPALDRKIARGQKSGICREAGFTEHGRTVAHMNCQWLWLQDLHKNKAEKSHNGWKRAHEFTSISENLHLFGRISWGFFFLPFFPMEAAPERNQCFSIWYYTHKHTGSMNEHLKKYMKFGGGTGIVGRWVHNQKKARDNRFNQTVFDIRNSHFKHFEQK